MELTIYEPSSAPEIRWNNEEIKREVKAVLERYDQLVYTDEQIKVAKADRAKLNKLYQAIDKKRKEVKKQCLEPYEKFEAQVKEILALIAEPIALIDSQIKEYEEVKKKEKLDQIQQAFIARGFQPFVKFEQVFEPKWLNATVSMKQIEQAMTDKMYQISTDLHTIDTLPEFAFEAKEVYKQSLDLNKAITEAQRMSAIQKAKVEAQRLKEQQLEETRRLAEEKAKQEVQTYEPIPEVEEPVPEAKPQAEGQWVRFEALLTVEQAKALKDFFEKLNIMFRPI